MAERTRPCVLYSDGSVLVNPGGPGGWAYALFSGRNWKTKNDPVARASGYCPETTNNRMEMLAVIEGLQEAITRKFTSVLVISDSQYVLRGIDSWSDSWKKNPDLWKQMQDLQDRIKVVTKFVPGHNGDHWNEWCDEAAGKAARKDFT